PRPGDAEETAALVQGAIGVLNRVLGLTHLDDPTFAPLIECQARAGDLRLALSRALSERRPINMKQAQDLMQPFENLMILVQDRGALSEQRWEELEANVARTLGRPLVTAAARRRLSAASAEPQTEAAQPPKTPESVEPPPSLGRLVEAPALPPPDVLGAALYRALVDGGRLRETFAELVRDIIGIAIPNPGLWADGGMIEHDDVTVAVMRASGYVGDPSERTVQLTDPAERVVDHGF